MLIVLLVRTVRQMREEIDLVENLVAELHALARQVGLAGQPHIASSMRYDADRLAVAVEKSRINKLKEQVNGQHSRFD